MHTDFRGNITDIREKTYLNIFYPSFVSLGMLAMFFLINLIVIKVRPRISKEDPGKSLENS